MAWEDNAQPGVPGPSPVAYEALFIDTAAAETDELRVRIPGFDDGEHAFELEGWLPRPGPAYPVAGDRAVVVEALAVDGESAAWWCIGWTPS